MSDATNMLDDEEKDMKQLVNNNKSNQTLKIEGQAAQYDVDDQAVHKDVLVNQALSEEKSKTCSQQKCIHLEGRDQDEKQDGQHVFKKLEEDKEEKSKGMLEQRGDQGMRCKKIKQEEQVVDQRMKTKDVEDKKDGLNKQFKENNRGKQEEQNVGLTRDEKDEQKLRGIQNNKEHDQDSQEEKGKEQIHNCLDKKDKNDQHEKNKFITPCK